MHRKSTLLEWKTHNVYPDNVTAYEAGLIGERNGDLEARGVILMGTCSLWNVIFFQYMICVPLKYETSM